MKRFSYFALAAMTAFALSACSDKDDVAENNSPSSALENPGSGYVAFNIQMPSTSAGATRANDDWDDGDADEYAINPAVNKSILVLFEGTVGDEANAEFFGAYNLTFQDATLSASSGCTTEARLTAALSDPGKLASGKKLFAYVALNSNQVFTVTGTTDLQIALASGTTSTIKYNDATRVKFSEFSQYQLASAKIQPYEDDGQTYMFMTSAPNANIQGGSVGTAPSTTATTIFTLAQVNEQNIYNTEAEAKINPAAEVYVERSAAKVTVTNSLGSTPTVSGNTDVAITADYFKWGVGNQAKAFFNNRQYKAEWNAYFNNANAEESAWSPVPTAKTPAVAAKYKYRFISDAEVHEHVYRTYWGEDPYYAGGYANTVTVGTGTYDYETLSSFAKESANSLYIPEHTMDENKMTHANSTYVGIELELEADFDGTKSKEFYTLPKYTGTDVVYQEAGLTKEIRTYLWNSAVFQNFIKVIIGTPVSGTSVYTDGDAAKAELVTSADKFVVAIDKTNVSAVSFTISIDDACAIHTSTATFNFGTGYESKTAEAYYNAVVKDELERLITNIVGTGYYYAAGKAYYLVPIQHFNEETPWIADNKLSSKYDDTYPNGTHQGGDTNKRKENYLGRWGVLRNNWYQLSVTGVRHIGTPKPVVPDNTPDDEVDKYISVLIHVMPWTVRTQNNINL